MEVRLNGDSRRSRWPSDFPKVTRTGRILGGKRSISSGVAVLRSRPPHEFRLRHDLQAQFVRLTAFQTIKTVASPPASGGAGSPHRGDLTGARSPCAPRAPARRRRDQRTGRSSRCRCDVPASPTSDASHQLTTISEVAIAIFVLLCGLAVATFLRMKRVHG